LLAWRRYEDLPSDAEGRQQLEPVVDVALQRAVDALRGVLLRSKEGAAVPSKQS
jgi:hypothetical protein